MNKKFVLSKVQQRTLDKLSTIEWKTAYEIRESLATLVVLENRGLIKRRKHGMSWLGWERNNIEWRKEKSKEVRKCVNP